MLLFVDVDQFLIVCHITTDFGSSNRVCLNSEYFIGFDYLPKEFFNMSQIKSISTDTINRMGYSYNYNANTKVSNHDSCRWENFVNLDTALWLKDIIIKGNKFIIRAFKSL